MIRKDCSNCPFFNDPIEGFRQYDEDLRSKYFIDKQLEDLFSSGYYPRAYVSKIDNFYEAFLKFAIPLIKEKGGYISTMPQKPQYYNDFKVFCYYTCRFISKTYGPNSNALEKLTRAFFFEVSNHKLHDRIPGIGAIADCLQNRVISGIDKTYMDASKSLNGLNPTPSMSKFYWHNIMQNPVRDAIKDQSYASLTYAYAVANVCFKYFSDWGENAQAIKEHWNRFSPLPYGYSYFDETYKQDRIKIGGLYFRTRF